MLLLPKSRLSQARTFTRRLGLESLEPRTLMAGDVGNTLATSTILGSISTAPTTINSTISPDTDIDLFRISALSGQVIDFNINTALNGPGGLGSYLRLFDSSGNQVAFNNDGNAPGENFVGYDAYLRYTVIVSDFYYIGVSNANNASYNPINDSNLISGGQNATGDYQLVINILPNDPNDALSEVGSLGAISTTPITINATIVTDIDVNLYRFTVTAGQVVDFNINTSQNGPGGLGSFIRLLNNQGLELDFNNDNNAPGEDFIGYDAYLRYTFTTGGTYYLGVSNANNTLYNPLTGAGDTAGGFNSIGDYQLVISSLPVDTNDAISEAPLIGAVSTTSLTVAGTLTTDIDVNMVRFTVTAGQVVDFDIDTTLNGPGGLGSYLRLFNSAGTQLAANNEDNAPGENVVSFDAYSRYTFTLGGIYYVGVSNANNTGYNPLTGNGDTAGGFFTVGDYQLIITALPIDTDDSLVEANVLGAVTTTPFNINSSLVTDIDVNLYRFSVSSGQTVDFNINTTLNGPGGLGSFLRLFDGNGTQLAFNNDAIAPGENTLGYDAYLRYTFSGAGNYYIGVSNANNTAYNANTGLGDTAGGFNSIGTYQLIISNVSNTNTLGVTINVASIPEINGTATGTVTRSSLNISQALVVFLSSSNTSAATVPSSITIPGNQFSATFAITGVDDHAVNGTHTVTITAAASTYVSGTQTLQVTDSNSLWHNAALPTDVNKSGFVTPLDAGIVINYLNSTNSTALPPGSPTLYFYDVNSDNAITPIDALIVINKLNSPAGLIAGEAGSAAIVADSLSFADFGSAAVPVVQETVAPVESNCATSSLALLDDFYSELGSTWGSLKGKRLAITAKS